VFVGGFPLFECYMCVLLVATIVVYFFKLFTLACPRDESASFVGIKPDVHFPCPRKVVVWVVNVTGTAVFSFNFVVPNLVNLHRS